MEESQIKRFEVQEGDAGRTDVFLARATGFSRSKVQRLLKTKSFSLAPAMPGKGVELSASEKVEVGQVYLLDEPPPEEVELKPQSIPLDILFEDDAIIVLNKPSRLVVHPAPGHTEGTLVNALLAHCPNMFSVGGQMRPGIVHRLDRDTSGLMVVAKNDTAFNALTAAFAAREVHKTYMAITCGVPEPYEGRIESQIGRSPKDRQKMAVLLKGGREAITEYEVEEDYGNAALLRVNILTGRTHQIRVHMRYIGCPVAGDRDYGSASFDSILPFRPARQLLHATELSLAHPTTGRSLRFKTPLPEDFEQMRDALAQMSI